MEKQLKPLPVPERACRLCGDANLSDVLFLKNSPPDISHLISRHDFGKDVPIDLQVCECARCGFVQLPEPPRVGFYKDYLVTASHSPQMRALQNEQAKRLSQQYKLHGKKVVEFGCGDGNFLSVLADHGMKPTGIEPSDRFCAEALKRGFPVHKGYVTAETKVPGGPYEGFATRQVFEHVWDIHGFLKGVRSTVAPGAIGMIEVPGLENMLENARFFDFFTDHVNYFSQRTLRFALEMNGFEVLECFRDMHGEYNVAIVRAGQPSDFGKANSAVRDLTKDLKDLVATKTREGKKVAGWGAGAKGVACFSISGVKGLKYVVDSDPFKQGLYLPVSRLEVVAPARLTQEPVDVLILTALIYRKEILKTLREDLRFAGEIWGLGERLEKL